MKIKYQADVVMIAAFALVAALAIVTPLTLTASPIRVLAAFGGILLGPGGLACRAAGRPWAECLAIGVAINVAVVMVLGLLLVSVGLWHPVPFELLIPVTTLGLSAVLLRKQMRSSPEAHR